MRITKPPEERKAELIQAARELFDKKGVNKTRVSDIVGLVGVAQGVFYYYFPSKESMVDAVVKQVYEELDEKALAIADNPALTFPQKLGNFIDLYLDLIDQFLGDDETSLENLDIDSIHAYPLLGQGQELLQKRLLELVDAGVSEGEVTVDYPRESLLVILSGLWVYAKSQLPTRQLIAALFEQSLGLPKNSLSTNSQSG